MRHPTNRESACNRNIPRILFLGVLTVGLTLAGPADALEVERTESVPFAHVKARLLVKFQPGTTGQRIATIHGLGGAIELKSLAGDPELKLVSLPEGADLATIRELYGSMPEVVYAQPDYVYTALVQPNDPRLAEQWGLHNVGQGVEDPTDYVCLGGSDSGLPCTGDAECTGACSMNSVPCDFNWECQDQCSQNGQPCSFNSDCECDYVCAGGSSVGQACTNDAQCGGTCQGGTNPGQSCAYDSQCGYGLCLGGGNPGSTCDDDGDCTGICVAGGNPGASCYSNSNCTSICEGGSDPGDSCMLDSQCGGICVAGTNPGQPCSGDFQCGQGICLGGFDAGDTCMDDYQCAGGCQGGSNPGTRCSNDFECHNGGTCIPGTCAEPTCAQGTCNQGTCTTGTCIEPDCVFWDCVLEHPNCVPGGACVSNLCIDASCGSWGGLYDFDIDAPEGWNTRRNAANVIIAIIDSGVDFSHEDIGPSWVNPGEIADNGLDDDGNGFTDDIDGWDFVNGDNDPFDDVWHGTFTTGVAAAVADNGLGISGVAWSSSIMALKALDANTSGATSDLVDAIDYAIENGAHVINASWGGGPYDQAMVDAIGRTDQAGILFVAAAGNDGFDNDLPSPIPDYPSSYDNDNIISVASVDRFGNLSDFSNYGETTVDLGAPGSHILSTTPYPHRYGYESGTSFAAPHVTATIALMYALNPKLGHLQAKQIVMSGVVLESSLQGRSVSGGVLNLANALDNTPACQPTTCGTAGAECGPIDDGCGGQADCGICPGSGVCVDNVCECTPLTCAAAGAQCGTIDDDCGGTLDCGGCGADEVCQDSICVCAPTTCAAAEAQCGDIDDDCGGTLDCGGCGADEVCQDNLCICAPTTCAEAGAQCGIIDDDCGGTVECGSCPVNHTCQGNVCVCTPLTCASFRCGTHTNGCGGTIYCGSCVGGGQPVHDPEHPVEIEQTQREREI